MVCGPGSSSVGGSTSEWERFIRELPARHTPRQQRPPLLLLLLMLLLLLLAGSIPNPTPATVGTMSATPVRAPSHAARLAFSIRITPRLKAPTAPHRLWYQQ
jgi:hypothetical protein